MAALGTGARVSGALSRAERAVVAQAMDLYAQGWFLMHNEEEAEWVRAKERCVLPVSAEFHVPGTLRARVRAGKLRVTCDSAFESVIRACAQPAPGREATWLDEDITRLFLLLHRAGHAHSVEAWAESSEGRVLVGGLYGLALGGAFCGESMFSRPDLGGTDASKVCLVHLVAHLRARGFLLLDAQLHNPHLEQFGAAIISDSEYTSRLRFALNQPRTWGKPGGAGAWDESLAATMW